MPKQLNVSLAFTADTSKAKAQLQDLQKTLNELSSNTIKDNVGTKMTEDLQKSVVAASQLKDMLQQAINPKTGNLDLSKFSDQLKSSGKTIQDYAQSLNNIGPQGTKAFMQLAQSVASAEVPIKRTSALLDNLKTTVMNAARWQISSTLIHGFMGAIQGAYGYAQDLNKSLTNIGIVTGHSTEKMAEFAEQANKSAQALSVSTTGYTDAALIYYQQGLSDKEVQARTDTTMKLSNVTGQSAEEVSSYMTAIWNNFADGSDNLEHFADAITALGANTASSSAEIAKGMQQFASVADTVGLSYENAAAALATIVAKTRQSESSVGNGLRTIFARLDSLKMGETLEDGVGLTKYTEALAKAGVQVLDQNGKLKDMDTILYDIGERWQTLDSTQKATLANTVGGVRQYSNLMALFDDFDKFKENAEIARNSDGSLQEQQERYEEGWQAASKRVKAAWQSVYQDLISDEFFITMLNGIEKVVQGIHTLIEGMGGLKGVLGLIGSLVTTIFADNLAKGIQNAVHNFKVFSGVAETNADILISKFNQVADQMGQDLQSTSASAEIQVLKDQIDFTTKLRKASDSISEANKAQLLSLNEITKEYGNAYVEAMKLKEAAEDQRANAAGDAREYAANLGNTVREKSQNRAKVDAEINSEHLDELANNFTAQQANLGERASIFADTQNFDVWKDSLLPDLEAEFSVVIDQSAELQDAFENVYSVLSDSKSTDEEKAAALQQLGEKFKEVADNSDLVKEHIADSMSTAAVDIAGGPGKEASELAQRMKDAAAAHFELKTATEEADNAQMNYTERLKQAEIEFENLKGKVDDYSTKIVTCARGMSQLWSAFTAFGKVMDTLNNKDLTWAEKLKAIIPSLLTGLPMLINGIKTLSGVQGGLFTAFSAGAKTFVTASELGVSGFGALSMAAGAFTGSIMAAISALLPFIAIAAGVAAAIWVVVKAFQAWEASTPEGKLKAANEELKESKETLDEATEAAKNADNAYENLVNTLDGLKDKKDAIDNLTEGTIEWKEAIADANTELLESLRSSGQLANAKLSYGKGGLIQVNNVDEIKENSRLEAIAANMAATFAQINVDNKTKDVAMAEAVKSIGNWVVNDKEAKEAYDNKDYAKYWELLNRDPEEKIGEYVDAIIKSGYAGQDLNTNSIDDLINAAGSQLDILNEIKDRQDILDAVQKAADQISQADKESDAYKKEVGRMAADAAGYDTSGMSGSELESFYLNLYNGIQEKVNSQWAALKDNPNEQMRLFAEGSGGKYKWDEENEQLIEAATSEIVDTSKIAQSEIELYGKAALAETAAKNTEQQDMAAYENRSHAETRYNVNERFQSQFGEGAQGTLYDAGLSQEQYQFALGLDLSQFKYAQEAIDYIIEACKEPHNIDVEIDADKLSNYKGKTEDLLADIKDFSEFLQNNLGDYEDLSEHLLECDEAAEMVAWSLIRFDDAMQDVSKNYDDWKEALDSKDVIAVSNAVKELRKTYGNLLDMDGSQLSDDFLKQGDNLELLNTILNGTEEEATQAYSKLQELAYVDLGKNLIPDFDSVESEWMNLYNTINDIVNDAHIIAGDDIEVGDVNYDSLVDSLNSMLAYLGDNKDAALAMMDDLGWEGELTEQPIEVEDPKQMQDIDVTTEEVPIPQQGVRWRIRDDGYSPELAGGMVNGIASKVTYNTGKPTEATDKKTTTVQAYQIKSGATLHKKAGGGPKVRDLPARKSRGGGGGKGSCFIAGTPIILKDTFKNIETIKPGDIVLSYNEENKKNVFNEVLQTMIHFVHEKIYSLFIKDEKLKVTGNHKFLITRNNKQEWIQAADLKVGDSVLLSNGTLQKIIKINSELKHETVYNFEVSDTHNYYVGKNQILAHNKGGGGGSGSGKTPQKQKREKPVKEEDRYHDIKSQIKDLTTEMSRLEKIKDRVWGKEKLKYMDKEIKNQEKQIELTKEYIKEAKNYLAEDKKRLDEIKMGAKYIKDESTGEWLLTNYEEVLQNIVNAQNKAVDEFNKAKERYENGEISEDELKAQEEAFNTDKENFEERKKILKQYEDTFNTVQEQVEKLIDDQWKLYDLKLEKVKVEVEVDLKMNDESRKLLEWSLKYMGDDLDRVSDKVANIGSQMRLWADDAENARSGIEKVFANHGVTLDLSAGGFDVDSIESQLRAAMGSGDYSPMTQAEVEYIQEMMQTIRDSNDSLKEGWEQALDAWDTAMDRAWDTLSRQVGKYDRYEKTLETYKDVVALTGKNLLNISNKDLDALNKNLINNAQNRIRASRVEYQNALVQLEGAKKLLEEAEASGNETAIQTLTDRVHEAEEKMEEMMDGYADAVQEALQRVEDAWSDALDYMEEDYKNAFGDLGLDWYSDQFERQKELSELYLPDYKKYHELNKSMADLQKNIAQTNNQLIKGKGRELLADIAEKMKEGAQVSEYEAGIIQRRVELLKAEDELLAARNAKSAVRMSRDTEGNFSYTYTADENAVGEAEQNYSDAYYNLRDFQVTGEQDLEGSMLQKMDEYYQRVREIEETFRDNEVGRTQALAALQSEYDQYISYYLNQFDVAYKWEGKLRNDDLMDMQRVLGVKLDNFNQFVDSWQGTILNRIMPGYETLNGFVNNWKKASEDAVEAINVAHKNFVNNTELTFNAAGTTTELFKEGYNLAMEAVQQDSDNTTKEIAALGEQMVLSYAKGFDEVARFTKQYLEDWASNRASDQESMQSMDDLMRKLGELKTTAETKRGETEEQLNQLDGAVTTAVTKISESLDGISGAMNDAAGAFNNMKNGWNDFINGIKNTSVPRWVTRAEYNSQGEPVSNATGGYTGDWHSSEGKLAILHEKELVLNKEDTKNMLDAVGIIRSMVTNTGRSLGNMLNYNSLALAGTGDTLQQQVHIDASFPNVTDHNEIELAINNLVNSASQYINRK